MSYFNSNHTSLPVACTIAFPPLQTLFSNHNNKSKACHTTISNESPPPLFNAITPPKYPLYLKYTGYADVVLQQYNERKAKLTTTINDDYRLPQYWNKRHNNNSVHIGLNGHDLTFNNNTITGGNKTTAITTTLQTNLPIRSQCGIYYFEISIIQKGLDGNFAIGFSRKNHKLNKLPGCDLYSFGYHGYDGKLYQHDTKGTSYGPTFISGDIIGCCINYATQSAFFTKNGLSLGIAFESINTSELLYPCIGLSTPGEKITANFGQEPFVFDIVHYVKSLQKTLTTTTCQQYDSNNTPKDAKDKYKVDTKADMDQLVISYLLQQGYTETAAALLNNIQHVKQQDYSKSVTINEDQYNRNKIRRLIMTGSIDTAIEQTNSLYPGLLNNFPDVLFQLKTRKFLDILMDDTPHSSSYTSPDHHNSSSDDTDDDTLSTYSGRSRTQSFSGYHDLYHQILYEEEEQLSMIKPCSFGHVNATPLSVAASGRRLSWAAVAAPSSFVDNTISVGEQEVYTTRRKSFSRIRRDSFDFLEEEEEDMKRMSIIRKAMNYGHQLQEEYQHHSKYYNKLLELFTLFDYSDPKSSPMSHLLDISLRDQVASQLNNAIHKYKNHAEDSALELIYKQSITIQKELIHSGHGKASLMNINHYFGK